MDSRTGKIVDIKELEKEPDYIAPKKGKKLWAKGSWWILTKKEPTINQRENGVKGHHLCLCGSGEKFRNCCRMIWGKQ